MNKTKPPPPPASPSLATRGRFRRRRPTLRRSPPLVAAAAGDRPAAAARGCAEAGVPASPPLSSPLRPFSRTPCPGRPPLPPSPPPVGAGCRGPDPAMGSPDLAGPWADLLSPGRSPPGLPRGLGGPCAAAVVPVGRPSLAWPAAGPGRRRSRLPGPLAGRPRRRRWGLPGPPAPPPNPGLGSGLGRPVAWWPPPPLGPGPGLRLWWLRRRRRSPWGCGLLRLWQLCASAARPGAGCRPGRPCLGVCGRPSGGLFSALPLLGLRLQGGIG